MVTPIPEARLSHEPARRALADGALTLRPSGEEVERRLRQIRDGLLAHSKVMRQPNFLAVHPLDLAFLFDRYDELFFSGRCRRALGGRLIDFRLSRRMTKAGGKTTRFRGRNGEVSYEIAIASSLLFEGFGETDRQITVCGLECANRLDALQRIFEHELVHLTEQLCWEESDCRAARFQGIAERLFLHRAHTHNLITRRERAAESGIRRGTRVSFEFEGRRLIGRVNRITKRATVLVEDPAGVLYSNGLRYKTYYVPIARLEPVPRHPIHP